MEKVIEQIRLKADACGDATKEQRARKGAYIDCLVLLKEALRQCNVVRQSEQFYCNQDDGDYNNNPCSEQCSFCKSAESLQ